MPRISKPWLLVVLIAALIAAVGLLAAFDPSSSRLFPPCLFHKLTGLYCPGCGTLRALHQLLNGNVRQAFRLNPLMILAMPFVLYALTAQALQYLFNKKIPTVLPKPAWIWTLLVLIILYTIARNIPLHPFTYLSPP